MLKTVSSITNALGALNYKGTWDASTNTPTLVSSVGTKGDYYVVSVAGSTSLDSISNWGIGDWAAFNGAVWQRVEGGADLNGVNLSVSDVATFAAGAVGAPAITTSGDTNTGIFFPAADTIAFSEGGAESVRFTSDGFVNIGTPTNNTLDQVGGARALIVQSSDASTTIAGSTNAVVICNSDTTTNNTSQLNFAAITGASANQYTSAVISCIFGARTNGQYPTGILTFSTSTSLNSAPTEKMRIANNGIVTMSAYGAGTATFSAAGVISSVSDETWKSKDGVPADPDSMLKKLEPGYWYYNDEKKEIFGVDRQLGFYAQNVNSAIGPEAAPIPEEGKPWGYYDRSVLAVTVMSLQKALATIESLTSRIEALEAK
jgi:hypothetical protein